MTGPVRAVGVLPGGELQLPDDPMTVGWWADGAAVGSPSGSVVLAGHVDSRAHGRGLFAVLREVRVGEAVIVHDSTGRAHAFRVVSRRSYPKRSLPGDLFDPRGAARLILVTCGGPFDPHARHYAENIVVEARPTGT